MNAHAFSRHHGRCPAILAAENRIRHKKKSRANGLQDFDGGDKGSRTPDLLNAIETLYQLSYIPKKENAHSLSKPGD